MRLEIDRHVIPRDEPPIGHEKSARCACRPVLITRYERVQDLAGGWSPLVQIELRNEAGGVLTTAPAEASGVNAEAPDRIGGFMLSAGSLPGWGEASIPNVATRVG